MLTFAPVARVITAFALATGITVLWLALCVGLVVIAATVLFLLGKDDRGRVHRG